jgi:TolB protein
MCRTRKTSPAHYLALLVTVAAFVVAITPAAQSVSARLRGKHNGKIVFISDRNYKGLSVWTMNPDGSSPMRLTDDKSRGEKLPNFSPVYDASPVWSPDGSKIAFISNRNYLFSLYVMNADGSNSRLVTDKVMEAAAPAWSPDGGKIAFTAGISGGFGMTRPSVDIYLVNIDGSGLTELTRDSGANSSPSWSPDGKQIVFTSTRDSDGKPRIWVMNADGSNQTLQPNNRDNTGIQGGQPVWSPDGAKILFTAYGACAGRGAVSLYVTNVDGGDSQLLIKDPKNCGWYSSPKWSPDGTRILASFKPEMTTPLEPARQIVVMNANGSNQINISNRGKYVFNSGLSSFMEAEADWQPLHEPRDSASSVVGFSAPSYTVYEDAGKLPITVTRTGNLKYAASVLYVTLVADMDIKHADDAATGTLRFAAGDASRTIAFPISDSGGLLRTTSYRIVLSDNEGNATFVGGLKETVVTILGRDRKKNPN